MTGIGDRVVVQEPLEASDIKYRHDRHMLRDALEKAIQALGRARFVLRLPGRQKTLNPQGEGENTRLYLRCRDKRSRS